MASFFLNLDALYAEWQEEGGALARSNPTADYQDKFRQAVSFVSWLSEGSELNLVDPSDWSDVLEDRFGMEQIEVADFIESTLCDPLYGDGRP